MREILFRGFHPCDGPETIVVDGEKVKGRLVEGYYMLISKTYFILPAGKCQRDVVNVLPSTVGQYTGLTDRTGKMIFEWDKLFSSHRNETYQVEWDKKLCRFRLACGNYHDDMVMADCYEVIGTVFDEVTP